MSDTSSKCPEMIGYVGDVRNLEENKGVAISNEKIIQWVERSNTVVFSTLFYSTDDVYHVGKMQTQLLKLNPDLKFKQISNIKEFINYVDTGMDRYEHPVKDIEMINVYSWWEIDVDYAEEARKRHEPEVRQISREDLNAIGEVVKHAIVEDLKKTIINIMTNNNGDMDQNKSNPLSDQEVYDTIKDKYHWDQASAIKDQILATSGTMKSGIDEMKEKRELLTKGIKSLPDVKPQTVVIKMSTGLAKHAGTIFEVYGAYGTMKNVAGLQDELSILDAKKKVLDCKNPSDINLKRCINISEKQLDKMKIFLKNERGF